MPRLESSSCAVCGKGVLVTQDGEICGQCRRPVHSLCRGQQFDDPSCCVMCGAPASAAPPGRAFAGGWGQLFSTRGRLSRLPYFWHSSLTSAVLFGLAVLSLILLPQHPVGALLFLVFLSAAALSSVTVTVRRLHDLDLGGAHWFLLLIPFANLALALVLLFRPGTKGPNSFGPDPLDQGRS